MSAPPPDDDATAFGLSWPGKAAAMAAAAAPPDAALVPWREESSSWDQTENVIIEGDNLAALHLLRPGYTGAVKVIYIDPPYNRATDLVYEDDFREDLRSYARRAPAATAALARGRNHARWLSMMYPRLVLARELLRDDGVIFVSVDDHEVHHLRTIMDEIFGESCFVSVVVVQANRRGQTYKAIAKTHEYLLVYGKTEAPDLLELPKADDALPFRDAAGPYDLWELRNRNPRFGRHNRPNLFYPLHVVSPPDDAGHARVSLSSEGALATVLPRNRAGIDGCWRWSREKVAALAQAGGLAGPMPVLLARRRRDGAWNVYERSRKATTKAKSIWDGTDVISEQGTLQLGALGLADAFDHPKPVGLLRRCLDLTVRPGDLAMDFFAGSGTLAQAALAAGPGQVRPRFLLVQRAEPAPGTWGTLAAVTRERVRRVAAALAGAPGAADCGFRAYRVVSPASEAHGADALLAAAFLRVGLELTTAAARAQIGGLDVAEAGGMLVVLGGAATREALAALVEKRPRHVAVARAAVPIDLRAELEAALARQGGSLHVL